MGHQGIAINDMCEEDKIEGLQIPKKKKILRVLIFILVTILNNKLSIMNFQN